MRPVVNDLRYSTIWNRASGRAGRPTLDDAALTDGAPVGDRDLPADRHNPRVFMDDPHELLQRVLIENRVGVERDDVGRRRRVDAGVQRVRLAAVRLVDHGHANDGGRERNGGLVHPADGRRGDRAAIREIGSAETECVPQPRERPIRRPIVDHDDLDSGIFAVDETGHAVHDRHFLVVCGDDHGERLGQVEPSMRSRSSTK